MRKNRLPLLDRKPVISSPAPLPRSFSFFLSVLNISGAILRVIKSTLAIYLVKVDTDRKLPTTFRPEVLHGA